MRTQNPPRDGVGLAFQLGSMSFVQTRQHTATATERQQCIATPDYFFRISPISRAMRLTDPVCRPSAAAISAAPRRRAITESCFRSRSVHSFGFDDFISRSSSPPRRRRYWEISGWRLLTSWSRRESDRPHGARSAHYRRAKALRAALPGPCGREQGAGAGALRELAANYG